MRHAATQGKPRPGLTRRDLLRLAPGVAALAMSCQPRHPSFLDLDLDTGRITGSIVGASHEIGHRLRLDERPEPQERRRVPVLIVGAGIAGLSAGWKLMNSGFTDFEILELEAEAGGKSRWGQNSVSAYPWGAHYLPLPTPESSAVREILQEMGLVEGVGADGEPVYDRRHLCHVPQERLFLDGRWRTGISAGALIAPARTPKEAAELAAFEGQVRQYRDYRDARGRPAFALPLAGSSDDDDLVALDRISMAEYFESRSWRSDRLRWYVDYCCRDDYGCTLDTTSAWAGWHYFASRPDEVKYLTWPEGNGRLVRHLERRLGGRVRTGMLVYRIRASGTPTGESPPVERIEVDTVDTRTETALGFEARQVIYALPRFSARHVVEGYRIGGSDQFTYAPWMVANLTVVRPPHGAAWDNTLYDSPSLGYVVATHQNLRIASGPSVLTYYLPLTHPDPAAARRFMLEQTWSDWVAMIFADLGQAHPDIESLVTHVDVMLWGHAMIRPIPGFVWGEARRRAADVQGGLRFAHSDMSGLSLFEEAQYQGVRAAEELMDDLGHPYRSSLGGS